MEYKRKNVKKKTERNQKEKGDKRIHSYLKKKERNIFNYRRKIL